MPASAINIAAAYGCCAIGVDVNPANLELAKAVIVRMKLTPGHMVSREISLSRVEGIFESMTQSANTGTFVVTKFL